jgi:hypothetical protein
MLLGLQALFLSLHVCPTWLRFGMVTLVVMRWLLMIGTWFPEIFAVPD